MGGPLSPGRHPHMVGWLHALAPFECHLVILHLLTHAAPCPFASAGLATGIAVADVDLARLASVRAKMPIAAHRAKGYPVYSEAAVAAAVRGLKRA